MKKVKRTDDMIMKIALSFHGTNENYLILEKHFLKIDIISYPQYIHYLSQVALGIELGMKSVLLYIGDIPQTHDIELLFNEMPKEFHDLFIKNPYPRKTVEKSLKKIKTMFEEFRYMITTNIDFFIDKNIFTSDKKIIFSQAIRLQNLQFIITLFDAVKEYYSMLGIRLKKNIVSKYQYIDISKKLDNSLLLSEIDKYAKEIKQEQGKNKGKNHA